MLDTMLANLGNDLGSPLIFHKRPSVLISQVLLCDAMGVTTLRLITM